MLIFESQQIQIMNVKPQKYYAEQFSKEQRIRRRDAGKEFEGVVDKLQTIIEEVVYDVKNRARKSSSIVQDISSLKGSYLKRKSLVAIKEENAARKRFYRKSQFEMNMLGNFIRLVDYMAVSGLVELIIRTNREFLQILKAPKKIGLFITTISFGSNGLVFSTDSSNISEVVRSMIDGMIQISEMVPRVLYMTSFKPLIAQAAARDKALLSRYGGFQTKLGQKISAKFGHSESDQMTHITESLTSKNVGPNVAEMIKTSHQFIKDTDEIHNTINSDYLMAKRKAEEFDEYHTVHDFAQSWNFVEYKKSEHSVSELRHHLDFHRE